MDLPVWHFPHLLHTIRGHVRSSNFEESSSRNSSRGETKHVTMFTLDTHGLFKQTTLPISYLCRIYRHTNTDKHTQTHTNTQDHTRRHTQTYADVTATAKSRHSHSNTQLKNCFSVRRICVNHAHFDGAALKRPGRSSLTLFWVPAARSAMWRTQQVVNLQSTPLGVFCCRLRASAWRTP